MSLKERYEYKKILTELFEEKEFVDLDTDEFGRIPMWMSHHKEPYQMYVCNEHKVGLTYHGCFKCVDKNRRTVEELNKQADKEANKN